MKRRYLLFVLAVCLIPAGCRSSWKRHGCCNDSRGSSLPPVGNNGVILGAPGTIPATQIPPERSSFFTPQEEILLPKSPASAPQSYTPAQPAPKPLNNPAPVRKVTPAPEKIAAATKPVGIPEFHVISPGIWTGLRPDIEGLDWLKAQGVQRMVYLRGFNEDDSSDKLQAKNRELKLDSIMIPGNAITAESYQKFDEAVRSTKPVFVYDRDGAFQGTFWYIHLRHRENLNPDAARIRTAALGYRDDSDLAASSKQVLATLR
jgi:protein tyrosine phosphatase (PTP) superfamily phosphohydrolase (DUF442 family)